MSAGALCSPFCLCCENRSQSCLDTHTHGALVFWAQKYTLSGAHTCSITHFRTVFPHTAPEDGVMQGPAGPHLTAAQEECSMHCRSGWVCVCVCACVCATSPPITFHLPHGSLLYGRQDSLPDHQELDQAASRLD